MSHKKFGPDRFSRFDVDWIQTDRQTDRQTNRQTDKQTYKSNLYIDSCCTLYSRNNSTLFVVLEKIKLR